ncbi:hypothetical protein ACFFRR_009784 [Megaselia abdita]
MAESTDQEKRINQWKRAALYTKTASAFLDTTSLANSEAEIEYDSRKQIKYGNAYQAAWGIFSEYCDNTTIHGIKYLGEQKRPILERLFWILVFILSIYACASLTINIWDKWNNNPVIVSFAEKSTPVWQIPFPAVTVCSETKSRQTVFNFTETYQKLTGNASNTLTDQETYYLNAIFQVCDAHMIEGTEFGTSLGNASEFVDAFRSLEPDFNETYFICKWRNAMVDCDTNFYSFLTEEGICYTFNSPDQTNIYRQEAHLPEFVFNTENIAESTWNLEDGYSERDLENEPFPARVMGAGARAGIFLVLKGQKIDYDLLCRGPVQGFKILLHTPGEIPQVSKQYLRVPFDQEVLISIKPKIITTSDGLKHYEPARRQCYFQNERYLRYFKLYTQVNCELECLANHTLSKCGCVKFSMPRNASTPVCGPSNIKCYNDAEDELLEHEFREGLKTSKENYRGETKCNCLPACTTIAYDAEISQAEYDFRSQFRAYKYFDYLDKNPDMQMARLSIFFKENQFLTSKRSELYGTTDFLANVGGLLGLFMGVSTLSFVELVYFCTVRLITNLKMRKKKLKELKDLEDAKQEIDEDPKSLVKQIQS